MLQQEVGPDFLQKIAVLMDKDAAAFAYQVKMFPAKGLAVHVLVTGAFAVAQHVFTDGPLRRQLFKVPVDGGLADVLIRAGKVPGHAAYRYVAASLGSYILEDPFPLPGTVVCRTFTNHGSFIADCGKIVNMKMNVVFI
jgi:hypothetical protein